MGNYSGNHPRFSRKQEESYDAKQAHNKDLTASARLHYLENDETHHPARQTENVLVNDSALDAKGRDAYATNPYNEGHEGGTHPARQGWWDTAKKVGRTGTRLLGDIGVQALDMFQPDHGRDDGSYRDPGATSYYDKLAQKDWENEHYDKSRKLVEEGKTYFTLANYLDDDGAGNARTGGPRASDKLKK